MAVGFTTTYNGRITQVDDLLVKREFFNDGGLFTWGEGDYGALGDGTITDRSSPSTTAAGGINWKQVAGAFGTYAAVKTDGTLWTWGANPLGGLGNNTVTNRSSPGTTSGGGTNWKQVSCGYQHTAAIKADGTLWTWGGNTTGELGTGNTTLRSSPGTTAGGGTNWKQVSGGLLCTAAVKTDGTLWTWGRNVNGMLGTGNTTSRSSPGTTAGGGTTWNTVACGGAGNYTTAIKTDGTLWTWGLNDFGQLGDGTVTNRSSPVTTAGGGTNWKQVSAGYYMWAAVKTDGTLWTCGYNSFGQLGNGTSGAANRRSSPGTTAGGGTTWKEASASLSCTFGLKTDGTLWSWGYNLYGFLGTGNTTNRSSPGTVIGGITNWKSLGQYPSAFTANYNNTISAITDLTI
jgi:alpha-tubulin suppressor-like RCC1 family protein